MSGPERMFCLHGDERGYPDVAALYEMVVDPDLDEDPGPQTPPVLVEEYTTRTGRDLVPGTDVIVERIAEMVWDEAGDLANDWHDRVQTNLAVQAAVEALRDEVGKTIAFFLSGKKVATHQLTWDAHGEPLLDGEPLYSTRPPAEHGDA